MACLFRQKVLKWYKMNCARKGHTGTMEMTKEDFSLLFGGSREATVILQDGKVLYQNPAVVSLLGELPLAMVLSELQQGCGAEYSVNLNLYGHALVVTAKPLGNLQLLRLHSAETKELISPALVAELKDLLYSQQLNTERLLESLSEQDSDLYGSSVRRSYFGLLNYTERLADMCQLAAGGLVVFPQLTDLTQLYRDVILTLELMLPEKYPVPSLSADEACYVNGDPKRLEELLLYLLSNALRHCKKDDSIRVRLRKEKNTVRLSVEDSGSGMENDTLARLFDTSATAALNGHMSLGLTLAKGVAQAHGGNLLIQSRSEEGTRVLVSLPAAQNKECPLQDSTPPEGLRIIQRILVDVLDLRAYREVFDD